MKLLALSCGRIRARKNVFIPDAPREEFLLSPVPVFLILHPEGNVLFDTGPHPEAFRNPLGRWGGLAKAFEPIGEDDSGILPQLGKLGFRPEDIRLVVNSHLHFDHAGGNSFFPRSTFLVSGKELEWARSPQSEGKGYFRQDWSHPLAYQEIEGELDLYHDGTLKILPLPGHTPGHQGLLVRLKKEGAMILSGDAVPCRENFLHSVASRNNLDPERTLATIREIRERVKQENAFLVHGHDPGQWEAIRKAPQFYE